jgi:L-asparaginase
VNVHLVATGGTLSSHLSDDGWTNLHGRELLADIDADLAVAGIDVTVEDVTAGPSSNLSVDDMLTVVGSVRAALDRGADGVVVTHGTDTMELTSFLAELVLGIGSDRRPVVFTGSMRVHSHVAADGPANLLDAIRVAASSTAVGREVLVCVNGELHAAATVHKCDATSLDAFTSAPFRPVGRVVDGAPRFDVPGPPPTSPTPNLHAEVPLITCYPGMPAADLATALDGARGAVVEVFGDLNAPMQLWQPIHDAWRAGTLVVLASRPFTDTTRNEGLDMLGAVGAGGLTAQKARLAAMAALGSGGDRDTAIELLHRHARPRDPHDRSSR